MQYQGDSLRPGTLLHHGTYRIIRFISAGGFGCTYEAEHIQLQGRVAIKEFFVHDICNRDGATGHVSVGTLSKVDMFDKLRVKFIREAQSVFALSHPGIVHVSDVFEENGTAYFVMDYIDGCSLADMVKQHGPLDERTALGYMHQVCSALDYVHANARLHLDIKPGNIMVDRSGRAILIDFGASKQYDSGTGENLSTLLGFTPGFAPPEQTSADVSKFLPATDVYALGATLYNLLTGDAPTTASLRSAGYDVTPLPSTVSATTRRAVEAALQLNKDARPQSVTQFAEMLFSEPKSRRASKAKRAPKPKPEAKPIEDTEQLATPEPASAPVSSSAQPWYRRYGIAIALAAVVVIGALIAKFAGGGDDDDPVVVNPDTVAVEEVTVLDDTAMPAIATEELNDEESTQLDEEEPAAASDPEPTKVAAPEATEPSSDPSKLPAETMGPAPAPTLTPRSFLEPRSDHSEAAHQPARSTQPATTSAPSASLTGTHNGHEWVDLGLSVKWATCNVGASNPSDYGNYYAWGEISTKSEYTEDNSRTYGKKIKEDIGGNPSYDVARANWGESWRMPTYAEIRELRYKCTWDWTTLNGHKGYRVTGPNRQTIFLPATGYREGTSLIKDGDWGNYWSSSPVSDPEYSKRQSWRLHFGPLAHYDYSNSRFNGYTVRPVLK